MKYSTRSAAALVTTGLLAGGGIAAAVTGLAQNSPVSTSSDAPQASRLDASADPALSAAVHDMLLRSQTMHARLLATREQLSHLDRRLEQQRELAQKAGRLQGVAGLPAGSAPRGQPGYTSTAPSVHTSTGASTPSTGSTAPSTHTTTGASGSTSTGSTAPSTHTTTGASGSTSTGSTRPSTHTTTGASGSTTGAGREVEHEDGGRDD